MILARGQPAALRGWPAFTKTAGLGLVCLVAFLAVRVPFGWRPDFGNINGTAGLMIGTNLGIGEPPYETDPVVPPGRRQSPLPDNDES